MRARELIGLGTTLVFAAALIVEPALAKSSLGIGSAAVTAQPSGGLFAPIFSQIATYQREFFTALRQALIQLKKDGSALPFLVGLSFAYGVFHAAGPGHGKAVISSYMLANEVELRRGILLSFVSSLLQAVSALALVGVGWYVLRGTAVSMTDATDVLEIASYALIALFGAWLLTRKLLRLFGGLRTGGTLAFAPPRLAKKQTDPAGALAFAAPGGAGFMRGGAPLMRPASAAFDAGICTDDEDTCACGRAHIPNPKDLGGRMTLGSAAAAVFAVGLRPCSGAIVVLTFALLNSLYLGGILSVFAMAIGTALTVSAIACVAVFAKGFALKASGGGTMGRAVAATVEIAGALFLLIVGLLLLGGALQTASA
ncbi:nickel/cobalt transporter [Aurantimonas marianensis]|uniref:Nickel/cobalt efflux system n=1 Tax=Aurantimonas marianensis TaxID=2920428 RepID=A0A9X2HAK1_9HYPH|nr:nickel/cobalt transporter [Aurantimonas marianensis]MCP3056450.1 nickel/cobalt transporter [Aurantimonas marianensis]